MAILCLDLEPRRTLPVSQSFSQVFKELRDARINDYMSLSMAVECYQYVPKTLKQL